VAEAWSRARRNFTEDLQVFCLLRPAKFNSISFNWLTSSLKLGELTSAESHTEISPGGSLKGLEAGRGMAIVNSVATLSLWRRPARAFSVLFQVFVC